MVVNIPFNSIQITTSLNIYCTIYRNIYYLKVVCYSRQEIAKGEFESLPLTSSVTGQLREFSEPISSSRKPSMTGLLLAGLKTKETIHAKGETWHKLQQGISHSRAVDHLQSYSQKFHISNLMYHKQAFLSELVLSPNLPLPHKQKMSRFYQKVQALVRGSHYFRFVYRYTNLCLGPQP